VTSYSIRIQLSKLETLNPELETPEPMHPVLFLSPFFLGGWYRISITVWIHSDSISLLSIRFSFELCHFDCSFKNDINWSSDKKFIYSFKSFVRYRCTG